MRGEGDNLLFVDGLAKGASQGSGRQRHLLQDGVLGVQLGAPALQHERGHHHRADVPRHVHLRRACQRARSALPIQPSPSCSCFWVLQTSKEEQLAQGKRNAHGTLAFCASQHACSKI